MADYIDARQAAHRLGVSRQTLYAYVSRGLIKALPGDDPRQSRYLADAVEQLAETRRRGRKPREIARATLDWGMPVLESSLTLIENGECYYRGQSAVELSQGASLEDIAALLWQAPVETAFPRRAPITIKAYLELASQAGNTLAAESLLPLFAVAARDEPTSAWRTDPAALARGSGDLVRILAACAIGQAPSSAPVHQQLAASWGVDAAGAGLIRQALVLCADHELNASSFTARCIASTGASLKAVIVGALAALSGIKHGATTTSVESLWTSIDPDAPARSLRDRLQAGGALPGFGHPLYPDGDIRARALLSAMGADFPEALKLTAAVDDLSGAAPSIDFALVALRRYLRLPEGSAFLLFAIGRSVGWIAHGLEQRTTNQLIRPRALYTGKRPTHRQKT
ncbi:citrate synthase family protein [Hoeflea alexandrii]|uniref:citrate synthase (unknown stereospecificity) n=1 Tax=Hoeflea alexandrii TaxID=288436 RepID=A0ABT1CQ47_9HYPH|nr:citrate synthase family protein [Hoeflea alexandrii]MCO6407660.1 helix-turn-helix domain-containing protein [Hoeflea alexandrii]MCY0153960.1 citrate synthase family protein [Hoeflea alexandrii]